MFDGFLDGLQTALVLAGILSTPDLTTLGGATGAVALMLALLAASVVLLTVLTIASPAPGGASDPHPRRAIDVSSPLAQSDPDAPGHPRPRAPQRAAPAA